MQLHALENNTSVFRKENIIHFFSCNCTHLKNNAAIPGKEHVTHVCTKQKKSGQRKEVPESRRTQPTMNVKWNMTITHSVLRFCAYGLYLPNSIGMSVNMCIYAIPFVLNLFLFLFECCYFASSPISYLILQHYAVTDLCSLYLSLSLSVCLSLFPF